ncbi:hypothetical protein VTH06DRAFT_4288 [Thermothelomyces fergusii]
MALPDPSSPLADDDALPVADAFLERSYLTYIVPFATDFRPEEALRDAGNSIAGAIAGIEQRDQLFFDETVDVYLILRAPYADEPALRSHLRRLVVTLDAHIVNGAPADRDGAPPAAEPIYSGVVEDAGQAFVVAEEEPPAGQGPRHAYAVWKLPVFLSRPRMRLQLPSVVFSGAASVRLDPEPSDRPGPPGDGYLPSCAPSGMNLLDSFADDPFLDGVRPRLSAQRVTKVAPLTRPKDALRRIGGLQALRLRIYPVLHTRVRFSRPNTSPPSPSVVALLDIDFTPYFDCEATLDRLSLAVTDGTVEDLNGQDGMRLPLGCVAHDHLTFLYKLAPQQRDAAAVRKAGSPGAELTIAIEVVLLVRPGGEPDPCTPRLVMRWTTGIDFTPPVNPGFGQPRAPPMQRAHRPSQLSIGGVDSQPLVSPSVIRPDALPALEAAAARTTTVEAALPDFGLTMTLAGPPGPVALGREFAWSVFVLRVVRPPSSSSTPAPTPTATATTTTAAAAAAAGAAGPRRDPPPVADAVLDETVVHAMQRASAVDAPELVCLSADVRIGPLAPHACAVAELRFLALREGVVGLEAVRVVDLATQEHADVRDLPLVVVERAEDGGGAGRTAVGT